MVSPLGTPAPWTLVADAYVNDVAPQFETLANRALDRAKASVGTRVLDCATGPGTLAFLAAARGAKVSAVDFSPTMIDHLLARIARDSTSGITADVADGMALPFDDGAFDAAFSMFGLMFFPDRAKGFRELLRVLAPGGCAVVSSWAPMDRIPLFREAFTGIFAALPDLPRGPPGFSLSTIDDAEREMREGGFRDVVAFEAGARRAVSEPRDRLAHVRAKHRARRSHAAHVRREHLSEGVVRGAQSPRRDDRRRSAIGDDDCNPHVRRALRAIRSGRLMSRIGAQNRPPRTPTRA